MFPTFTGNSRRPRQVNLSNRNANPFAKPDPWAKATPAHSSQNALAKAQADRIARAHERERTQAAIHIQKTYRGYVSRKAYKDAQRLQWDQQENIDIDAMSIDGKEEFTSYPSEDEAYRQLKCLLIFARLSTQEDLARTWRFFQRFRKTSADDTGACTSASWQTSYLKLEDLCLDALEHSTGAANMKALLSLLKYFARRTSFRIPAQATHYYKAVANALDHGVVDLNLITAPLEVISASTLVAYQGLLALLQLPQLGRRLEDIGGLGRLADSINCKLLGSALAHSLRSDMYLELKNDVSGQPPTLEKWTWLLAHVIYFYRHAHAFKSPERYASDNDFVFDVATVLSALVDHIEVESQVLDLDTEPTSSQASENNRLVPSFVRDQLLSLINQASIGGLLTQIGSRDTLDNFEQGHGNSHTRTLASYILTMFRLFPRRGDEIRMWLYLGSTSSKTGGDTHVAIPVISLFWQSARNTAIFEEISKEPLAAVQLLKPDAPTNSSAKPTSTQLARQAEIDDQWRVILMFIELYTFVLKVMDDEEFFANGRVDDSGRQNSLRLADIQELTIFLKHLGFTMYYNAADITASQEEDEKKDISSLFQSPGQSSTTSSVAQGIQANHIAGIHGISLDYFKGLVTGLLRAIYERDSRRIFMPKGHWLMTKRFNMTNFIDAVVEEEERRLKVQEEDDEDGTTSDHEQDEATRDSSGLVGTGHAQRLRRVDRLQRQQRKASRKRYLQLVAPRLEILQNMPFLIPFSTRVQIFRRFVFLDQLKRRNGFADPELWRLSQATGMGAAGMMAPNNPLQRHHAKIRREHEFDDAFEQFYELGPALKEPIQITFVDQFDTPEAGIDGGGVTKEFLTSVTNQAFAPSEGIQLFAENEQHLLYPNPSVVEEQRELLREAGFADTDAEARAAISDLLQRYEFLGRIIGKCLYEGILVDIRFAGFFLLKWALTGGSGSAARESGYRANLNDLRDLDEGLYQGLLQLKNYPGDVETDFSLNFTITDTLNLPTFPSSSAALSASRVSTQRREKNISRELKAAGSTLPVTNANRLVYISYVARHRLSSQPYLQTTAFLRGLSALVQPSWLSMFNQSELQTLVSGGAAPIDVADLRRNTIYGGVYVIGDDGAEHPSVSLFWRVMEDFDDADRRKVLKFVTSTPRAPLLGFGSLMPRFSIRDSGEDEGRLPSTSTCVNLLKLPRYRTEKGCKEKLLLAVRSGAGFDLS